LISRSSELLVDIERERHKLHEVASKHPRDMERLLKTRRRLDKLIIEYQKLSICSHRKEE